MALHGYNARQQFNYGGTGVLIMRIVNRCNFDKDYPRETFILGSMPEESAKRISRAINKELSGPSAPRFWDVVPDDYVLKDEEEDY